MAIYACEKFATNVFRGRQRQGGKEGRESGGGRRLGDRAIGVSYSVPACRFWAEEDDSWRVPYQWKLRR